MTEEPEVLSLGELLRARREELEMTVRQLAGATGATAENITQYEKGVVPPLELRQKLQKALALVKQFETEKKEAIAKARSAALNAAIKDEAKGSVIFKALKEDISEEDFQAVVKALADVQAVIDNSELFVEKGAQVEVKETVEESPVAKALKARLSKSV
jgi:transcriptional regulator with XRE-family HTH domain